MKFSDGTTRDLTELARLIIENKGKISPEDWTIAFKYGTVPAELHEGNLYLTITGQECIQYHKCLKSLGAEISLEQSSEREVDRELWYFVCEVFLDTDSTKAKANVRKRIASLQARIQKPVELYEVLVPIDGHLRLNEHDFELAGTRVFEMHDKEATNWGIRKEKPTDRMLYDAVVDKAVALLTEKGSDPWKAVDRAREKLRTVLNTLRLSLLIDHDPRVIGWKIHDIQMLFKLGEATGVKKAGSTGPVLPGWRLGFRSVELKVDDIISKQLSQSAEFLECLFNENEMPGRLRDRLLRAVEWIGGSVTRESVDDKVIDVCTALETLLTTQDDGRKGEAIALRMTMLYLSLKEPFFDPLQLLDLYNKRSEVIHGSKRKICTESDYTTGRWIAIDVFQKALAFIKKNSITKHIAFIIALQSQPDLFQKAVDFCTHNPEFRDDIIEAASKIKKSQSVE